jgi:heparosan-N-sulfate-glucuronate 5-epimerase
LSLKKLIVLAVIAGQLFFSSAALACSSYVTEYKENGYNYQKYMQKYSVNNDYLNFSTAKSFPKDKFTWDANGVPMVKYGTRIEYNPVTVAQAALHYHGKFLKTGDPQYKDKFFNQVEALIRLQSKDGAFRYNFSYRIPHLHVNYKPGWISGMAQGQALSVFSRAYTLKKDLRYKRAGNAALNFLLTPKEKGGPMTDLSHISTKWKDQVWFEEYVTVKNNYTLNGFNFTLLGLYDWGYTPGLETHGAAKAAKMFHKGQDSVKKLLKKYDIGGFTSYDLSHLTMKQDPHVVVPYHAVHIYQMYVLYTITGSSYFIKYHNEWKKFVE